MEQGKNKLSRISSTFYKARTYILLFLAAFLFLYLKNNFHFIKIFPYLSPITVTTKPYFNPNRNPRWIRLRKRTIDTTIEPVLDHPSNFLTLILTRLLRPTTVPVAPLNIPKTYLFHFNPYITPEQRKSVKSRLKSEFGVKFGLYVPENSYIGTTSPAIAETIWSTFQNEKKKDQQDLLLWIGEMKPSDKTMEEEKLKKLLQLHVEQNQKLDVLSSAQCLNKKFFERRLMAMDNSLEKIFRKNSTEFVVYAHIAKTDVNSDALTNIKNQVEFNLGNSFINFIQPSKTKIVIGVYGTEKTEKLVQILTNAGLVHWVEVKLPSVTNNKFSSRVMQTSAPIGTASKTPIWDRGLRGKGEVIGVGDTGLDYYNCLFYDDANKVPFQRYQTEVVSTNHRKIEGYWSMIDSRDEDSGHGTHVSGIAAGSGHPTLANATIKGYNSLANEAKIAFLDAGCDTQDGCSCPGGISGTSCECDIKPLGVCPKRFGVVFLPLDLNSGYFPYFYSKGARVVSNSWGTGYYRDFSYGYSTSSSEIDNFAWNHKDFLPLFAAGNSGAQLSYASVTSESESKNALVVGATQSSIDSFVESVNFVNYERVAANIKQELYQIYCMESSSYYDSKICDLAQKFDATKCCNDGGQCNPITSSCCGTQDFPDFKVIGFRCCPKCIQYELQNEKAHFDPSNLAAFTARGPALDGRVKPDIVAVGDKIMSSWSKGTIPSKSCNFDQGPSDALILREGTSMACPLAAAAGILVREFFKRGHYNPANPEVPDMRNAFEPSGALVKAMLIHSAQSLTGYIYLISIHKWWPLQFQSGHRFSLKKPYLEGHGRIELNEVMKPTAGLYLPNTIDKVIASNDVHSYCVNVKSSAKPFKVTLVWTDAPGSPSAGITLVNDLDLILVTPTRSVIYGNGVYSHIKYSRDEPDYLNNVEAIDWGSITPGKYNVIVRGTAVPKGPQPYALVISGDVEDAGLAGGCRTLPNHLMSANDLAFYKSTTFAIGIAAVVIVVILGALCLFLFAKYYQVTTSSAGYKDTSMAESSAGVYMNVDAVDKQKKTGPTELKTLQEESQGQTGYFGIQVEDEDEDELAEHGEANDVKPKPKNFRFTEDDL